MYALSNWCETNKQMTRAAPSTHMQGWVWLLGQLHVVPQGTQVLLHVLDSCVSLLAATLRCVGSSGATWLVHEVLSMGCCFTFVASAASNVQGSKGNCLKTVVDLLCLCWLCLARLLLAIVQLAVYSSCSFRSRGESTRVTHTHHLLKSTCGALILWYNLTI